MTVRIVIECNNAAFDRHPKYEVMRILSQVRKSILNENVDLRCAGDELKLRDINGNTVGKLEVSE